jgi:hypothetical protein
MLKLGERQGSLSFGAASECRSEVESVLNQFSSETFKRKSRDVYNFTTSLLDVCKKTISLDGDYGERAYTFIERFSPCMHIVNTYKPVSKNFMLMKNAVSFTDMILNDLGNGLNVAFVSMSSDMCQTVLLEVKRKYPELETAIYTSITDDAIKLNDFGDINTSWKVNFITYSPTIEAGCDSNIQNHYDKMYGLICPQSCSARSFLQIYSRIRHVKSNNIYIMRKWLIIPIVHILLRKFKLLYLMYSILILMSEKPFMTDLVMHIVK